MGMFARIGIIGVVVGAFAAIVRAHFHADEREVDDEQQPMTLAEVEEALHAAGERLKLNTGNSVVDVLKALGLRSDMAFRKQLAAECEFPVPYTGSAEQNRALRDLIVRKVADFQFPMPAE